MSYRSVVNGLSPVHFPYEGGIDETGAADLTVVGAVNQTTDTPGAGIPDYYECDGVDDHLWAADGSPFDLTGTHTVLWWARRPNAEQEAWANHWAKGDGGYQVRQNGGTELAMRYSLRGSGGSVDADSGSDFWHSSWQMFAAVYDDTNQTLYEIGSGGATQIAQEARTGAVANTDQRWSVAAQYDGGSARRFYEGDFVPPVVFDYALTTTKLAAIYDAKDEADTGTPPEASGTVSAEASLSAVGYVSPAADGASTVEGSLSAVGHVTPQASGSVSALGSLAATGRLTAEAAGSVTVEGSLTASGMAPVGASGTVAAEGSLTATGYKAPSAAGTVQAEGSLSATGYVAVEASGTVSAEASLSATGQALEAAQASGNVTVEGSLSATGSVPSVIPEASGTVTAQGSLTGTGHATVEASGQVTAEGSLTAVGQLTAAASGNVTVEGSLTGTGYTVLSGSGVITAEASLTAVGRSSPILPFHVAIVDGVFGPQVVDGVFGPQRVNVDLSDYGG